MARIIVFDVNETLLDLAALDPFFATHFGDTGKRREWFGQMLQSAMVATITDNYHNFGELAIGALEMMAMRYGMALTEADRDVVRQGMRTLPAHADVRPNLERLRAAGLRLASLTNSTMAVAEAQLTNAGIRDLFTDVLSADTVQRLKPAREAYQMAADALGVPLAGYRLVAAHSWDVAGALRAGCAAAFISRPGQVLDPLALMPDISGATLTEVTDQILRIDTGA